MSYSQKPSDVLAVLGVVNPQTVNNAAVTTPWIVLNRAQKVLFVLLLGAIDTTLTAIKLQAATDNAGTGAVDISGKSATSLATTDDNKQVLLNIDAGELADVGANYSYVRLTATVGNGATGAVVSAVVLGTDARYQPASQLNSATVAQVV